MKYSFTRWLILLVSLGCSSGVYSQERLGLRISNYSGIQSVTLNPALMSDSPLQWDVSLFSGGVFFEENYVYYQRSSLLTLATQDYPPEVYRNLRRFSGLATAEAWGPAFMFKVREHTFGFYAGARAWANANRIDEELNYDNVTDSLVFIGNIEPFTAGALTWGEVGISYSRPLMDHQYFRISGGVNFKILLGLDGGHLWNRSSFDLLRLDRGVQFATSDIQLSYATNYKEGPDGNTSYDFAVNGYGAALDLGITITDLDAIESGQHHYWKLGISLMDVGMVRFGRNAYQHELVRTDTTDFIKTDYENVQNLGDVILVANQQIFDAEDATLIDNKFSVWLPTSLGIYMDYAVIDRLYVTGVATLPLAFRRPSIRRKGSVSITPRYEMRWFEIGLPFTLFQYRYPRFGMYLRMGPLTLGTDNLNSKVIPGRLDGGDFYLALKVHSGMFRTRQKKPGECPEFR